MSYLQISLDSVMVSHLKQYYYISVLQSWLNCLNSRKSVCAVSLISQNPLILFLMSLLFIPGPNQTCQFTYFADLVVIFLVILNKHWCLVSFLLELMPLLEYLKAQYTCPSCFMLTISFYIILLFPSIVLERFNWINTCM